MLADTGRGLIGTAGEVLSADTLSQLPGMEGYRRDGRAPSHHCSEERVGCPRKPGLEGKEEATSP